MAHNDTKWRLSITKCCIANYGVDSKQDSHCSNRRINSKEPLEFFKPTISTPQRCNTKMMDTYDSYKSDVINTNSPSK
jgi:hypothetical protein